MRTLKCLVAVTAAALALAGPLAAGAHADDPAGSSDGSTASSDGSTASSDGSTASSDGSAGTPSQARAQFWITAPAAGGIVRGDEVDLQVYFDAATSCYGDGDSAQWSIDGVPVSDPASPGGTEASDGPGLPAGDYTTDDEGFDATTVADGPHTLGLTFTGTDCVSGENYQLSKSIPVVVNNAPIGISWSRAAGSVVSGAAAPLRVSTSDLGADVQEVDFSGRGVAPGDGGPSTTVDADDQPNGRYVVSASVSDDADVTTGASLALVVDNHSGLRLSRKGRRLAITSSAVMRSRQGVVLQRRAGKHWSQAGTVLLDTHGHGTLTVTKAGSYRLVTASATMWPGTSTAIHIS